MRSHLLLKHLHRGGVHLLSQLTSPEPKELQNPFVRFENGEEFPAQLVGTDEKTDISVLRINAGHNLAYVTFGNSDALHIGDMVTAIGYPFSLPQTVTRGIVSNLLTSSFAVEHARLIQTDAPTNPGNSGGPLFNMAGDVVGISDAIWGIHNPMSGNMAQNAGLNFYIAARQVTAEVHQIEKYGEIRPGELRFTFDDAVRQHEGWPDVPIGAKIGTVQNGSAAAVVGLQPGDVIISFDHTPIKNAGDLDAMVYLTEPGQIVPVQINRGARQFQFQLPMDGAALKQQPTPVAQAPSI